MVLYIVNELKENTELKKKLECLRYFAHDLPIAFVYNNP